MIHFEIPKNQSSIIKVIGVGGGGSNAVNYMYNLGLDGVDFIVCNTDSQALSQSPIPNKIQLGPHLTQGLGAGSKPDIGRQAGEESLEDITKILKVNTRMAFVTAGMGGGTGTGAAPVVARICKELGILTVGIVTTPFGYEGLKRFKNAEEGINQMKESVDTMLIISNDKLREQFGSLPFSQAFNKADNILATAAKCITDLITVDGKVNLDFNDVQTVMKEGGRAILGSAQAAGENRAQIAVEQALNSPLLNDDEIQGAKWILLNITSASGDYEHTLDELEIIQGYVQQQAGFNCDIILGMGHDNTLDDKLSVTIIATGFNYKEIPSVEEVKEKAPEKIVVALDQKPIVTHQNSVQEAINIKEEKVVTVDPLAPILVINSEPTTPTAIPEPETVKENNPITFALEMPKEEEKEIKPEPIKHELPEVAEAANAFQEFELKIKTAEERAKEQEPEKVKIGERYLTEQELEERRRFEEQKKAFEEKADRLRRMSFNISGSENSSDIENIPAYQRRNAQVDNTNNNDTLSGYTVSNDNEGNVKINSKNAFLNGNKPD